MGRSGFTAQVSEALADREVSLWRDDVLLDEAERLAEPGERFGEGLDHALVRDCCLRKNVGATVSAEILRVRREHLGRVDLDALQARWYLAQVAAAGRARLYRGRLGDADQRAGPRHRRKGRHAAARHAGEPR